jgi:predicted transposase/invertase (TIGR01784 family)
VKTDSIFYRLFQTLPGSFFELIGQPAAQAGAYEFASVEIKQTAFRIDGVFVPVAGTEGLPVYFVEVQFQLDSDFYRRFFSEIFLYLRQNRGVDRWRAAVLYPKRSVESSDTGPYEELLASRRVQRLYLDELGPEADRSVGLGIVQLIVEAEATAVDRARRLISQVQQELESDASQRDILELIQTVLLYKFSKLSPQEVQQMLGLEEFKQSRLYQGIRQEALEEGKQEGRLQAKLEAVPRLLERGFSVGEVAQILGLEVEQVRQAAPQ